MKKKVVWALCAIVIICAIVAMLVFALGGKKNSGNENAVIDLSGSWKVAAYVSGDNIQIIDNEYMVFTESAVTDYRDGAEYASSSYQINEARELNLKDISRQYIVDIKTDNYFCLYENQTTYMELIRVPSTDHKAVIVETSYLTGQWDIKYRNTDKVFDGDYLLFENGMISQFSASTNSVVATTDYEVQNDNHLIVTAWGKDMVIYPLSDNVILMIELSTDNGFIWELHKAG